MSLGVLQGRGEKRARRGVSGLGASAPNCWDLIAPCDPAVANQLHGQILGLMGTLASARAAAAQGDPNAAAAAQNFQAILNAMVADCTRLGGQCQTQLGIVRAKLAQYGCDATRGPFAEGLQQMANEKNGPADQVPENGVFDAATCAAFWKAFGRAPTIADVQASIDPSTSLMFATQKHCGAPDNFSVKLPGCPKPVTSANKPPTGYGTKPPPITQPVVTPIGPPPPKQMSMAMVGGLVAAVAVVGYAVAKKKGWIH
jgi:hypothetical protein